MKATYEPQEYWEKRLSKDFSLASVGFLGLGVQYNRWLYRARLRALNKLLTISRTDPRGMTVLEIGVGTGFYVDYWGKRGVTHIAGLDITQRSVSSLKLKYPQYDFIRADISAAELPISEKRFDVITAFDVLFHIVDEDRFDQAIANIRKFCHKQTRILISDSFLSESRAAGFHELQRTMARYQQALSKAGLEPVMTVPVFYFMNNPIDRNRLNSRVLRGAVSTVWRFVAMLPLARRLGRPGEAVGYSVGLILYLLDGIVLRCTAIGPGSKLLLARLKDGGDVKCP